MKKLTFCNPVNINYQYQYSYNGRESADPAVVLYKDKYFLFASHGSGYWVSDDLVNWDFIKVDLQKQPEFALFAPATLVIGDRMYITHSQGGSVLYSDDPFDPDSWVNIGRPYEWHDPAFLLDDDGSVYIYEGLGDYSIHCSKLDPDNGFRVLEGPVPVFYSDYKNRGYDRCGDNNEIERKPSLEGAWCNKINGKYYLTYATPGTEFSTYCDGVAVSESPMGPFENCDNSPMVFKSTGFMRGAGHGCLFEDKNGNLWKMDTTSISVNHMFERRLALFPAKIIDGRLYTNTLRGDYPMFYPHETSSPFDEADAGLSLLSYNAKVKASSALDEDHAPDRAFDENMKTWWSANTGEAGEWIEADLGKKYAVSSVQINFADTGITPCEGRGNGFSYKYALEVSDDGEVWRMPVDRRDNAEDFPHEYFQFENESFRYIRLSNHGAFPAGGKFSVSGIRVFGAPVGDLPPYAPDFSAVRDEDGRNMTVTWEEVPGAEGYFVRYGAHENELYTQYQIINGTKAGIRSLINGVQYNVTVDAYNKGGTTKGKTVKKAQRREKMGRKITLMDGAVGTTLWGIAEANGVAKEPVWKYNVEHPEFVEELTRRYLDVGCEIILANTFGANGPAVKRSSNYTVSEVITGGVKAAKKVLDGTGVKLCLSIGPLTQLLEPYGDLEEEECAAIYDEMLDAGVGAGVDMILIQTFMDLAMMRVATAEALKYGLPVMCSMTFEKNGKTMFGNSVQDTIDTLVPLGISAIGLNCSLGPDLALPIIKEFSEKTDLPLLFKPNAGKPILAADGSTAAAYTAQQFAEDIRPALQFVSYIGGCCGSDAEYIKEIKKML